jgi:hypothetical protein
MKTRLLHLEIQTKMGQSRGKKHPPIRRPIPHTILRLASLTTKMVRSLTPTSIEENRRARLHSPPPRPFFLWRRNSKRSTCVSATLTPSASIPTAASTPSTFRSSSTTASSAPPPAEVRWREADPHEGRSRRVDRTTRVEEQK